MTIRRLVKIIFIVLWLPQSLYATSADVNANRDQNTQISFLTLADIHFDPFVACKQQRPCKLIGALRNASVSEWAHLFSVAETAPSTYGEDTNFQLLRSSLLAAARAEKIQRPQFVIILGDVFGHDFRRKYKRFSGDNTIAGYQMFLKKTNEFVATEVASAFPQTDVYTVVGNNDTYHHDYYVASNGKFFADGVRYWSKLIKNGNSRHQFQQRFPVDGYYVVNLPRTNLRLIIINSVLFSNLARGRNISAAANQQLRWLQQELEQTKNANQKAIIAMHIPMGIDLFAGWLFRIIDLWEPDYTKQFEAILKINSEHIAGVLAGHLHSSWSQKLKFKRPYQDISLIGTPSISPVFGNHPAFKVYFYDGNRRIEEQKTYLNLLDHSGWNVP